MILVYIYIYIYVCVCVCGVCVCVYAWVYVCMYVYKWVSGCIYIYIYCNVVGLSQILSKKRRKKLGGFHLNPVTKCSFVLIFINVSIIKTGLLNEFTNRLRSRTMNYLKLVRRQSKLLNRGILNLNLKTLVGWWVRTLHNIYIHVYVSACVCVCACVCVYMCVCVCVCVCKSIQVKNI